MHMTLCSKNNTIQPGKKKILLCSSHCSYNTVYKWSMQCKQCSQIQYLGFKDSLSTCRARWGRTLWNPTAFSILLENKSKKSPWCGAGDVVHVSDALCDKSLALWHCSMKSSSSPECTWMSWVISYIPLLDLSLLKQLSQAPQTGSAFSRAHCSLYRFFSTLDDGLWITHKSGMFWRVLQHQEGSQSIE